MPVNSLAYIHVSRHCCGRHGLWPTWYRPYRLVFSPVSFVLSVPVQVIAWKDWRLPIMCQAGRKTLLTYLLTHSLMLLIYISVHLRAIFSVGRLVWCVVFLQMSLSSANLLTLTSSYIFFFCIHCTATVTSSVHVLLGRHPLPTRLPSRTCETIKNRASHHMCTVRRMVISVSQYFSWNVTFLLLFYVLPVHSLCLSSWFLEYVWSMSIQMHQFVWSVSCSGSSSRIHISILRTHSSPADVSSMPVSSFLWAVLSAVKMPLWPLLYMKGALKMQDQKMEDRKM